MDKKIQKLIEGLKSTDEKSLLLTLKEIRKDGNATILPALMKTIFQSNNEKILTEGLAILNSLKDSDCVPYLMEALKQEDLKDFHHHIAAAIWESGLDVADRLEELIAIAIKGDYLTALEIATIIENTEAGFPYEEVTEATLTINEYVEDGEDEAKNVLLLSIGVQLSEMMGD